FLQRAYDQMIHDVCLQNLPVVFAVDRAGLVGSDGETHQGIFDLSYLSSIPNMVVMSPKHRWELADMVRFALDYDGPIAVRYPRGSAYDEYEKYRQPIELGKSEMIHEEKDIAIFSIGHMFEEAVKVYENLKEKGYHCSLVNGRFVKPFDENMIEKLAKNHRLIAVVEENVKSGACSEKVLECAAKKNLDVKVLPLTLPDQYVEHGSIDVLRKETGIDAESLTEKIILAYKEIQA
ncbi:MAG: transketolase C-terminal domain-containing protein, partial [Lachnospiraceae bacterium]